MRQNDLNAELVKGSFSWFQAIVNIIGDRLVGIEVTHEHPDVDITPRCQVAFILRDAYTRRYPNDLSRLMRIPGYRMLHLYYRGRNEFPFNARTTVLFDFEDEEPCPKDEAVKMANILGFTVAYEGLNNSHHTSRLSPDIC